MRLFKRKSRLQRLLETVEGSIAEPIAKRAHLPGRPPDKAVKAGLIAAGGLTGLTAGSAGISSLRRRNEEAEGDS
jgi:predicted hydrolase (HD superfamily)